ncbi:RNA-binding S4 domain-containing protein [Phaeovulum sp.]|uniref:RNA-binding S4 domain-containing protein n=1 Tax=Phaeovulum sp. TaxID=2934796 RepID=UPI0039E3E8D0
MTETAQPGRIRIDKWLWYARLYKTRVLAAEVVSKGKIRVNGQKTTKPGRAIGPGDVLAFSWAGQPRSLCLLACGARRGPAAEASALYKDLASPQDHVPDKPQTTKRPF